MEGKKQVEKGGTHAHVPFSGVRGPFFVVKSNCVDVRQKTAISITRLQEC